MADASARPCRVWIFNHYATPPDRPGGTRHYWLGRGIQRHGGDVSIFAAGFDHSASREMRLRGRALVKDEWFDGVRFVWLRTVSYRGNTWRRMLNMLSYAVMVTVAAIGRPRPDVVVGSTVHPFAALAGWFVARLRRARFVYEVRDLWPQTMIDLGAMASGSASARMLYAIEAFLVRRADLVITVLPGMARYLTSRRLPTDRVRYLPNGAIVADAADPIGRRTTSTASIDDPFSRALEGLRTKREAGVTLLVWTGAHGFVNGLDVMIRAIVLAEARDGPRMHLLLVGDGPEKPALQRLVASLGTTAVTFLAPISKDRIPELLAQVDIGVIHGKRTPVYRYGVSFNKLFDYMAAGLPIAFACDTFADPVEASGAGITVPPDDPDALADAFVALASMTPADRERLGAAGRAYLAREHDLVRIGDSFAELVGCIPAAVDVDPPGR